MKRGRIRRDTRVTQNKVRMRVVLWYHEFMHDTVDEEFPSLSSDQVISYSHDNLECKINDIGLEQSSDDVFLEDQIINEYGIDLVSTEVSTEYEAVEDVEPYDGDFEASSSMHVGESITSGSEYNIPEFEGELPIIVEENKAAINLVKNFEMLKAPTTTMNYTHPHGTNKQGNKLITTALPPNQMQILAASLSGKPLNMFDNSYHSSNTTVSRKPGTQSNSSP